MTRLRSVHGTSSPVISFVSKSMSFEPPLPDAVSPQVVRGHMSPTGASPIHQHGSAAMPPLLDGASLQNGHNLFDFHCNFVPTWKTMDLESTSFLVPPLPDDVYPVSPRDHMSPTGASPIRQQESASVPISFGGSRRFIIGQSANDGLDLESRQLQFVEAPVMLSGCGETMILTQPDCNLFHEAGGSYTIDRTIGATHLAMAQALETSASHIIDRTIGVKYVEGLGRAPCALGSLSQTSGCNVFPQASFLSPSPSFVRTIGPVTTSDRRTHVEASGALSQTSDCNSLHKASGLYTIGTTHVEESVMAPQALGSPSQRFDCTFFDEANGSYIINESIGGAYVEGSEMAAQANICGRWAIQEHTLPAELMYEFDIAPDGRVRGQGRYGKSSAWMSSVVGTLQGNRLQWEEYVVNGGGGSGVQKIGTFSCFVVDGCLCRGEGLLDGGRKLSFDGTKVCLDQKTEDPTNAISEFAEVEKDNMIEEETPVDVPKVLTSPQCHKQGMQCASSSARVKLTPIHQQSSSAARVKLTPLSLPMGVAKSSRFPWEAPSPLADDLQVEGAFASRSRPLADDLQVEADFASDQISMEGSVSDDSDWDSERLAVEAAFAAYKENSVSDVSHMDTERLAVEAAFAAHRISKENSVSDVSHMDTERLAVEAAFASRRNSKESSVSDVSHMDIERLAVESAFATHRISMASSVSDFSHLDTERLLESSVWDISKPAVEAAFGTAVESAVLAECTKKLVPELVFTKFAANTPMNTGYPQSTQVMRPRSEPEIEPEMLGNAEDGQPTEDRPVSILRAGESTAFGADDADQSTPATSMPLVPLLKLVIFDFDCTLSAFHLYSSLSGSACGGATLPTEPPFAKTELGQLRRLLVMEADPREHMNGDMTGFVEKLFGGAERINNLKAFLEALTKIAGVECIVCSRGMVGPIRKCLEQVGLLHFFTEIFGRIDSQLGATPYDIAVQKMGVREGEKCYLGPHDMQMICKSTVIAKCLEKRGLSRNEALFVDDTAEEIQHAASICRTILVSGQNGVSDIEMNSILQMIYDVFPDA